MVQLVVPVPQFEKRFYLPSCAVIPPATNMRMVLAIRVQDISKRTLEPMAGIAQSV
jgi:hypothetical protein